MIDENNKYSKMQKEWYESQADNMNIENHKIHNDNPDYYSILLKDVVDNPEKWGNKIVCDVGCGCGRNLINLYKMVDWKLLIGMDISKNNLIHTKENIIKIFSEDHIKKIRTIESNGIDIQELESDYVDFVMSTIVFEHIAVYEIRYNLLSEIYRVMKSEGIFSFQMGYDPEPEKLNTSDGREYHDYYENYYDAKGTNSRCDCIVTYPNQVIKDLEDIGFNNITYKISHAWSSGHQYWIYMRCEK